MPPVRLTDSELSAVFAACRPLPVEARDQFLVDVAAALQGRPEPGPGDVYRAVVEAQARHFDPPVFGAGNRVGQGKYHR
jgi:hypothetical protein